MKVRAKIGGFYQGIKREQGETFDYNPAVATMQALESSSIELLEPIPEGVERPEPDAGRAPKSPAPPAAPQGRRAAP